MKGSPVVEFNPSARSSGMAQAIFALILAMGFALGAFGTYFFFTRQVSALNSRFDHLEQMLVAPPPAAADTHTLTPQPGKKHGQH